MLAAGLLFFGIGAGFTSGQVARFERAAAMEIGSRLQGERKQVKVEAQPDLAWGSLHKASISARDFSLDGLPLYTEPWRSQKGRLGSLELALADFRLRGLRIQKLEASIPGCRFDLSLALNKREFRLSRSGVGTGTVTVAEADLAEWINAKYAEIKRCTVKVDRDVVWVEGYGEFLIVKTNFTVIAKLKAVDGTKLTLHDAKIYFDWVRADPLAAQTLLKTLNPVVDLDKDLGLADAIKVTDIRLRDGVVRASGLTKIPVAPAENIKQ